MGGSSSKVGRTLPAKAKKSVSRVLENSSPTPFLCPRAVARETRNQNIEKDGKDPQFLAKLAHIGQVDIPSASRNTSAINKMSAIYRMRDVSEEQATSTRPVRNRILAGSLSNLLDDCKFVTSRKELDKLAARYAVDISVLESLAKFINTPSVDERTTVRAVDEDGQEKVLMKAIWTNPPLNGIDTAGQK